MNHQDLVKKTEEVPKDFKKSQVLMYILGQESHLSLEWYQDQYLNTQQAHQFIKKKKLKEIRSLKSPRLVTSTSPKQT